MRLKSSVAIFSVIISLFGSNVVLANPITAEEEAAAILKENIFIYGFIIILILLLAIVLCIRIHRKNVNIIKSDSKHNKMDNQGEQ